MKKIFLVLLSLTFTLHLSAQESKIGVKAGINYSTLVGDDVESSDKDPGLLGFAFGISDEIEMNFGTLKGEILYSQKGVKWSDNDISLSMIFNYVEFGTGMIFNVAEQVNLHGGIYSGYLLSGKMIFELDGDKESDDFDDLDELDSRWDIGLNIGGAYVLNEQTQIELSYKMGLVNFMSVDGDEDEAKHSGLQAGVVYFF